MDIHETCVAAGHVPCVCGAMPDKPCACQPGRFHLSRFCRARTDGILTFVQFAAVIADADVYTGTTLVIDPGAEWGFSRIADLIDGGAS